MQTLVTMVDATLVIEKLRLAAQRRKSHLEEQSKEDPDTTELYRRLKDLEDFVDGRIAVLLKAHPAYDWFSRVKGIGPENIAKVVGLIDITRCDTPSALWKFCGYSVEDGVAPRRTRGKKLTYNSQLRSLCWRLATSLMRGGGKFYDYYLKEKDKYYQSYIGKGMQIVPATSLPKEKGKRYEPENVLSEGHLHNRALRKMIKLFLCLLWVVWREEQGLPVTKPYVIEKLGHHALIDPWEMVDR